MSRRKYLYRVMRQQGDGWVLVQHYQSSAAARQRAHALALASWGRSFRIERCDPVTFDPTPAVCTLATYKGGVAS